MPLPGFWSNYPAFAIVSKNLLAHLLDEKHQKVAVLGDLESKEYFLRCNSSASGRS